MSKRPEFVTIEDIVRWNLNMENDPRLPKVALEWDILKEVCYAGLWLAEQLDVLQCPHEFITRIQFTAGRCSFGNDPWEVSQKFLEMYKLNQLEFEPDPDNIN